MPNPKSVDQALEETLTAARIFAQEHAGEKGIADTFGYFTSHPVAGLNRKRLKVMLGILDERSRSLGRPLRILDLACGAGLIGCAVANLGHTVLGLDLNGDEIHLAELFRAKLPGSSACGFRRTDLLNEPDWEQTAERTLGGKPDFVILAYALHHLPGVESFIGRLGRWLGPDTQLLINEENPGSPLFRLKHVVRTLIQHDTDVEWHRTYGGWKQALEAQRFSVTPALGVDIVPSLERVLPLRCWSLVFTARQS